MLTSTLPQGSPEGYFVQSTEEEGEPSKGLDLRNLSVHNLNKTLILWYILLKMFDWGMLPTH